MSLSALETFLLW